MLSAYFKSAYSNGVIDYKNIKINASGKSAPLTPDTTIDYIAIIEPDKWTLQFVNCNLKAGNTPAHASVINFIDFLNEDYQLPVPFASSNQQLGAYRQATVVSGNGYDPSKDFIGRLRILADNTNLGNTYIGLQAFGPSFNIPNNVGNALIFTPNIVCSLDDTF